MADSLFGLIGVLVISLVLVGSNTDTVIAILHTLNMEVTNVRVLWMRNKHVTLPPVQVSKMILGPCT